METIFEIYQKPNMSLDGTVNLLVIGSKKRKVKKGLRISGLKHKQSDLARFKLPPFAGLPLY